MFEKNSYVVYKRDVCKVVDIKKNSFTNLDSYILVPSFDDSLKISVPTDNKNGYLRNLLSKKEIEKLINSMPDIKPIETDSHSLENEYRNLFHSGKHEDLVKIIKTTYLRNKERIESKRNVGEKDKEYFNKAEKYLYNELSVVLGKTYDETREYVINKVRENDKK